MNDSPQMLIRAYGSWQPKPLATVAEEPAGFQNPRSSFVPAGSNTGRINWKSKKAADKRKKAAVNPTAGFSGYNPPALKDLQHQNRLKSRRFYPKKKFSRFAPFAPRNTTSFIIRAKKSGGIASLISPCPVTPAILPTPTFSPSRERLVDMAKEEWGVDGYGSMKGLIRLRSSAGRGGAEDEEDADEGSSESDVEEHVEVERRLDHDLSRFEIVYPSHGEEQGAAVATAAYLLENRVDDQDTHITQLEEENLTLKERLFLMEREMGDLRMRLELLETGYMNNNSSSHNKKSGDEDVEEDDHDVNDNLNSGEAASRNDGGGDVCSARSVGDYEAAAIAAGKPMQE